MPKIKDLPSNKELYESSRKKQIEINKQTNKVAPMIETHKKRQENKIKGEMVASKQKKTESQINKPFVSFLIRLFFANMSLIFAFTMSGYFIRSGNPYFETQFYAMFITFNLLVYVVTAIIFNDGQIYGYPILLLPLIISFFVFGL